MQTDSGLDGPHPRWRHRFAFPNRDEMAQKKKFYAVRCGHKHGVYRTWEECKTQVDGYSKADYKGFSTLKDAEDYLNDGVKKPKPPSAEQVRGHHRASTSMA